jgi:hypothetical protein
MTPNVGYECPGCGAQLLIEPASSRCVRCTAAERERCGGVQLGLLEVPAASLFGEPASRQERRRLARDHAELLDGLH